MRIDKLKLTFEIWSPCPLLGRPSQFYFYSVSWQPFCIRQHLTWFAGSWILVGIQLFPCRQVKYVTMDCRFCCDEHCKKVAVLNGVLTALNRCLKINSVPFLLRFTLISCGIRFDLAIHTKWSRANRFQCPGLSINDNLKTKVFNWFMMCLLSVTISG